MFRKNVVLTSEAMLVSIFVDDKVVPSGVFTISYASGARFIVVIVTQTQTLQVRSVLCRGGLNS